MCRWRGFKRRQQVTISKPAKLSGERSKQLTRSVMTAFFGLLLSVIAQHSIPWDNIWSFGEIDDWIA